MSPAKPRRLGRGLDALIGASGAGGSAANASNLTRLPVARIRPNPFQPRTEFSPAELAELQASIAASGLLQPITVRRHGDAYELVAGERRLRAVTNLGWTDVPAIIKDLDDQTLLVLALVENLQRADLNPIEEARGYRRLLGEFGLTHQQVAEAVGKDRSTVTNLLRVLGLPDVVQLAVSEGRLTAGHAKALLALDDHDSIVEIAELIERKALSVRQTEQLARDAKSGGAPDAPNDRQKSVPPRESARRDPAAAAVEDELRRYLQTDVQISLSGADRGEVRIAFYSSDDLDRVLDLILREKRAAV